MDCSLLREKAGQRGDSEGPMRRGPTGTSFPKRDPWAERDPTEKWPAWAASGPFHCVLSKEQDSPWRGLRPPNQKSLLWPFTSSPPTPGETLVRVKYHAGRDRLRCNLPFGSSR